MHWSWLRRRTALVHIRSGMNIGDILHLTWGDIRREYKKKISPLCFEVTRQKIDVPFMTFICDWGLSMLRVHLSKAGKKLDSDPIYTMSERTVQWHFKKMADRWIGNYEGRNPTRVHSLRSAFRTFLGDASMPIDEMRFFIGHQLPALWNNGGVRRGRA